MAKPGHEAAYRAQLRGVDVSQRAFAWRERVVVSDGEMNPGFVGDCRVKE